MRITLTDGCELAVDIDGAGPDLLLLSGLSGTSSFWQPVIGELAKTFRVIRLDQRGTARSTRGTAATTIDCLAADCLAVLEAVDSKHPLLLGHSTGGVILQSMALTRPGSFAGLILSATWARPNRTMSELSRSRSAILDAIPKEYSAMAAYLGNPADWIEAHWSIYQSMLDGAPAMPSQQQLMADRIEALLAFDRSAELGGIASPTLIQGAEDDLIVPAFVTRELQGLMPKADLAMLPSGGHFFPVTRPDAFIDNVVAFARTIRHI